MGANLQLDYDFVVPAKGALPLRWHEHMQGRAG